MSLASDVTNGRAQVIHNQYRYRGVCKRVEGGGWRDAPTLGVPLSMLSTH